MLREFILGNNQPGLVTNTSGGAVSVVGGESTELIPEVLPGQTGIFVGSGATQSTYTFPSATIAAWESFTQTAIPTPSASGVSGGPSSPGSTQPAGGTGGALSLSPSLWHLVLLCALSLLY